MLHNPENQIKHHNANPHPVSHPVSTKEKVEKKGPNPEKMEKEENKC